jgi:hypothetical protein
MVEPIVLKSSKEDLYPKFWTIPFFRHIVLEWGLLCLVSYMHKAVGK